MESLNRSSGVKLYNLKVSCLIVIIATVLGPLSVLIVQWFEPLPPWNGINQYVSSYHKVHSISILFGFVLLIGFVKFIAASISLGEKDQKGHLTAAIIYTAIYGTLAGFNYIVNSSYIHHVFNENLDVVEILTMNNPKSICWSIEMYSYGFLGLATYSIAPVFRASATIVNMLKINGIASVAGALVTFFKLSWVLSPVGMIAYIGWNIFIVLTMVLIIRKYKSETNGE